MKTRLVVTGMGAITPIGLGVGDYWNNLVQGKCGVDYITRFDTDKLPVKIAAEIRDFDASLLLPRSVAKSSSIFMQFAYAASHEAIEQAGLENIDKDRIGISMGTALAGVGEIANSGEEYFKSASGRISPHLVPKVIGNMAAAHLSITFGFHGPGFTLGTACSAGGDAIMAACMLILAGEADIMVATGAESALCPSVISSLAQAKALSRKNETPKSASRPFDLHRDGFVIGEGAGSIIIESEEHALKRGAEIFAVISGWGNSLDGHHITAPHPEGTGAAACMRSALKRADISPKKIDYINAHGTSTQLGDKAETIALKDVFGEKENVPPTSSTKGATGHLMGAGGLTEIIACIKAMEQGIIPPTLSLEQPDPECDLDYVPKIARKKILKTVMSNSLGFGGQNSSIILSDYQSGENVNVPVQE